MTEKEISFEEVDLKNIDAIRAVLKKVVLLIFPYI